MGEPTVVSVDPDHPHRAVLEKGTAGERKGYATPFNVGAIFLLAGVGLWFFGPRIPWPR